MNNNTSNLTPMHYEDIIYKAKTFINELQVVQEKYFTDLTEHLNLTENGEDWLFDYIYNTTEEDKYDDFEHYLLEFKQQYKNLVKKQDVPYNSSETFLATDFGEFSPMMHMSSCEAELETTFPGSWDLSESETDSFNLKSIDCTLTHNNKSKSDFIYKNQTDEYGFKLNLDLDSNHSASSASKFSFDKMDKSFLDWLNSKECKEAYGKYKNLH